MRLAMKPLLPLVVVFAALTLSLASSQNQSTAGQGWSITNAG